MNIHGFLWIKVFFRFVVNTPQSPSSRHIYYQYNVVASRFPLNGFMHDAFIRVAEKMNGLVEERLLQQLNRSASASIGHSSPDIVFNRTQASIILDIHSHPQGPNTPAKIAQRLNLEPSRISHQIKSLKLQGWVLACPGIGKLPALKLTQKANTAALSAYEAKRYLEGQLRKGQAKEFDIVKTVFLPAFEEKIANLLKLKPRRLREKRKPDED